MAILNFSLICGACKIFLLLLLLVRLWYCGCCYTGGFEGLRGDAIPGLGTPPFLFVFFQNAPWGFFCMMDITGSLNMTGESVCA